MSTHPMLALGLPGGPEWLIILAVVLIFFGHRIPGMARSLGSGISEFKQGLKEGGSKDDGDESKGEEDAASSAKP